MLAAMTFGLIQSKSDRRNAARELLADVINRFLRFAAILAGVVIMVTGFAIAPLPGPFGLPIAVVGLMIVMRNSMWAKRRFIDAKRRWPNWIYPVRRLMRREPEFAPVMWQQMLRTERLLLARGSRFMGRLRRRLFRRKRRAEALARGA